MTGGTARFGGKRVLACQDQGQQEEGHARKTCILQGMALLVGEKRSVPGRDRNIISEFEGSTRD